MLRRHPPRRLSGCRGRRASATRTWPRFCRGEIQYSEVRPAAWDATARLGDMDLDHIDLAVLYPTSLLGLQSNLDVEFGTVQARAYNDWCSDHVQQGGGACSVPGPCRPCTIPTTWRGWPAEIYRVAELPGMVSVFMRPNPAVEWKQFNDAVYDPIWAAAQDTGLPIGLHPFLAPDLPGVCQGLRLGELPAAERHGVAELRRIRGRG